MGFDLSTAGEASRNDLADITLITAHHPSRQGRSCVVAVFSAVVIAVREVADVRIPDATDVLGDCLNVTDVRRSILVILLHLDGIDEAFRSLAVLSVGVNFEVRLGTREDCSFSKKTTLPFRFLRASSLGALLLVKTLHHRFGLLGFQPPFIVAVVAVSAKDVLVGRHFELLLGSEL